MDFYANNSSLSMNGSNSISEIQNDIVILNDTVVFKATTQTITGDKTLSGTTTFTGDIVANGFTITPTELGYLDGLTSNAQAQINLKANDADVVHLSGNETIAGEKRFVDDVLIKPTGNTTDTQLKITGNYNAVDFKKSLAVFSNISSGGVNDYGGYIGSDRQNFGNFLIGRYHNNAIVGGVFDPAIRIDWTDYTTNTADIKIFQPITSTIGGLERLTVSSTNDTVINNDRVYIKNGGNTRIEVNDNGDTTINNTDNIILKSNGITKYYNSPTANTHINDAHYIRNIDNTITYASFDGSNNIISNVDNTLTASGTNTLSAVNNTITATGTNTINGATAITGTTTITGNIVANSLTITPTELGYIDGLTSNAQTQITARALDSAVVHNFGDESVAGVKSFTADNMYVNRITFTYEQYLRLGSVINNTFFDYRSGGNSIDYDVRCNSTGGTSSVGFGNYKVEAGTTTLDSKTTNTIKSGGTAKITTNTTDNTITNNNNSITTSAVSGLNSMYVSGGLAVNLLWAGGTSSYNWLYAQGTGAYNLIQTTGTGTNTIQNDANTTGTANHIVANGTGGGNRLQTGAGGVNRLEGYDTNSSNLLAVNGSTKIQTTSVLNTINNTTNVLSVSGQPKITTTSSTNTITNQVNNIIATHDVNIHLSNVPQLVFSSTTGTTLYGDSKIAYVDANLNIQPKSQTGISYLNFCSGGNSNYDTRLRSDGGTATTAKGYLSVEAQQFIAPHYWVGYYGGSNQLLSGCIYANQSNTSLTGGGSVAMSLGGFSRATYSIQQGVIPVNARFYSCVFMSDNANQTTSRTITLEMTGIDRFSCVCPTGTAYQSILGTAITGGGYWDLTANNGYYLQIKTSGTSTTAKAWNVMLFWQQI